MKPSCLTIALLATLSTAAVNSPPPQKGGIPYRNDELVPVTCLNRTLDGEHVSDRHGNLQYIPFPTCAETHEPLALRFARDERVNCTITLTDPLFHLLEYYLHGDAPLACRVPSASPRGERARRLALDSNGGRGSAAAGTNGDDEAGAAVADAGYVPLVFALAGALQKSHLHVAPVLNVAVHHRPALAGRNGRDKGGTVEAAGAYSASPARWGKRVVIGDELPLELRVRWFPADGLPPGGAGGSAGQGYAAPGGGWGVGFWWELAWMMGIGYVVCYLQIRGVPWRREERDVLPTVQAQRHKYGPAMTQGFGKRE